MEVYASCYKRIRTIITADNSLNPLPDMTILDSSSSTANKDMTSKMCTNGDTDRVKNIVGKGEIARNDNVYKSYLFLMLQNECLWSKGIMMFVWES